MVKTLKSGVFLGAFGYQGSVKLMRGSGV